MPTSTRLPATGRLTMLVIVALALLIPLTPAGADIIVVDEGDQVPALRFAGDTRYHTAADIATDDTAAAATFEPGTVVVALGDDFPDALGAAYAAGLSDAPILLSTRDDLTDPTREALTALAPEQIILVGGPAAVSPEVEAELGTFATTVTRVAGENRDETGAAVAALGDADGDGALDNGLTTAFVASSADPIGALVAGPISAAAGVPLILTNPADVSPAAIDAIQSLGITEVVIVGGPGYVSNNVAGQLTSIPDVSVRRIIGGSPGLLSVQTARFAVENYGFSTNHVNLATSDTFADALALSPHAALDYTGPAPILLTEDGALGEQVEAYMAEIGVCGFLAVHVAGGTAAVDDDVLAAARDALTRDEPCTDAETLVGTVGGSGGFQHLQAFSEAAEASLVDAEGFAQEGEELVPTRASGTPGYDASVAYVSEQLTAAGYEVTTQDFAFDLFEELEPTEVLIDGEPLTEEQASIMSYSGSGDVTGTVELVDADLGAGNPGTGEENDGDSDSGCEPEDFEGFTEGNIALMQRGSCAFGQKALNAFEAGASAAIIFNQGFDEETQPVILGTLGGEIDPDFVTIGMDYATGLALATDDTLTVQIIAETLVTPSTSSNVLAEYAGTDPDSVVMVGAHLDSVLEGPGINDNGTGSAAILELALGLARTGIEVTNTVRFAWWGAEEAGLVGSDSYIFGDGEDLEGISDEVYNAIKLYLNFDMVGSPNYIRGVYDGDGDAFELSGPPGSDDIEATFAEWFASVGLPVVPTEFSGRSDYQAFIDVGIPAGGLFTGAEGIKTEEEADLFGGSAGVAYDPCYHARCDTIDNPNLEVFDQNIDAIAAVGLSYAQSLEGIPERPVEGETFAAAQSARDASVHVGYDADHGHGHGDYNDRLAS